AQRRRARGARPTTVRTLTGTGTAGYRVGGRRWELPARGFWQAHRGAPAAYARQVGEWLAPWASAAVVWDLYGGAGVFAAAALDLGAAEVHVVDTDAAALAAAAVVFAGEPVRTVRAPVSPSSLADLPAPGAVILDPPRQGAGAAVVDAVVAAGPTAIVHVGCDPAAFARDIGRVSAAGYRLTAVRGFDAFPLTHHVEAMALLVRAETSVD
ncbi:MAG: class I SAM-dependent RNA methyltransferase, partial [Gordonia sp. (in: high G+C Gram-positive bacteria)]